MAANKPYYRAYPSNFISGLMGMKADAQGIYRMLLDLMYDKWAPIPWDSLSARAKAEQQRTIARQCGTTVRRLNQVVAELLASKKIGKNDSGDLVNPRFLREIDAVYGDKIEKNSEKNSGKIDSGSNDTNGLQPDSRARKGQSPESIGQARQALPAHSFEVQAKAVQPAIQQVCKLLGVDLQASTHRHMWTDQLLVMLRDDCLDLRLDVLPVIEDFVRRKVTTGQMNPETIRTLRMFRADFIASKRARELHSHIAKAMTEAPPAKAAAMTDDEWYQALRAFLMIGAWPRTDWGPNPCEPGCLAPPHLLKRAQALWDKNGQHPTTVYVGNSEEPWSAEKSRFKTPTPFAPIKA